MVTGFKQCMPSSSRSLTNQVISEVAAHMAMYSASAELLETIPCFLDFQLIGDLPRSMT